MPAITLDYVGHAALTDRLLEADPDWTWEPVAYGADGYPLIDRDGGLWIRLTVCGVTRLGYGDAQGKVGGDAMKERIGDALRNAAMRFGAALDLWHKGQLHVEEEEEAPATVSAAQIAEIERLAGDAGVSVTTICNVANVKMLKELTIEAYPSLEKKLKKTIEAKEKS